MFSLVNYRKGYSVSIAAVVLLASLLSIYSCENGKNMVIEVIQPSEETLASVYTYLALKPTTGENTIAPINRFNDWGPYNIQEKTREGLYYSLAVDDDPALDEPEREWIRVNTITNKFDKDFEHWIYLHARSEVIYDLSDSSYAEFDGYIGAADPWAINDAACGHRGTIKFLFLVDDETVYKSPVIAGIEQNEPIHVKFEIPTNAQKLTIIVTDAGDGIGCDHWILGNARLLQRFDTTQDMPVYSLYDVNLDGKVDNTDLELVSAAIGQRQPTNPRLDIDRNGIIDGQDIILVSDNFSETTIDTAEQDIVIQEVPQPPQKTLDTIDTYLALKPTTDENTITPINRSNDWGPYVTQEKTREGLYYSLAVDDDPALGEPEYEWIRMSAITNRFGFEYWIYLHARSEIIYDLSDSNYAEFDGYIGATEGNKHDPGCRLGGTIKFLFLVDDETVYKSPVIVGIEQNEPIHVKFEIPANAQKLTIIVTDAGNGNYCDGWTLGNARLLHHREMDNQ